VSDEDRATRAQVRREIAEVLARLADRLDKRATVIAGNGDLDESAYDRAEPISEVAGVVRAIAEGLS